jgi:nucleolar protein 14
MVTHLFVHGQIRQSAETAKAPLELYKLPPVSIKQYNPRFDEAFVPQRDLDLDRERAERSKLRRQHKKELKGAIRELRKDNAFIEHHRAIKLKEQRAIRDERGKAIETFFAQQQFEAKIGAGKRKGRRK